LVITLFCSPLIETSIEIDMFMIGSRIDCFVTARNKNLFSYATVTIRPNFQLT
jgi:hypothetical protein